jgi:cyclophilin family peptidyl-prolyl cis-trans isomerase
MTVRRALAAALLSVSAALAAPPASAFLPRMDDCDLQLLADGDRVYVDTPLGRLTLQLFPSVAPNTVQNFLGYVERGDYADSVVHRIVPDFVTQTGGIRSSGIFFEEIETQDPIANEPCVSNVAGTIAMAKLDGDPDSATSQWFVNLSDNSENLDDQNGGFTVFGRVLGDGIEVARAIAELDLDLAAPLDPGDPTGPRALPELPPFYAAVPIRLWSNFQSAPVLQLPTVDPAPAYGCFDSQQAGVVLLENPQSINDWEPNPAHDLPYTIVSPACIGAGTGATPVLPCSAPGRRVLRADAETGDFVPDASAPLHFAEVLMTCDELAASEASFDVRLGAIGAQLQTGFVSTSYTFAAPEPSPVGLGAGSVLALAALARRSRRRAG